MPRLEAPDAWLIRSVQSGDRVVDLRVGSGIVLEIGRDLVRRSTDEQVVFAGGRRVLPGLRDAHVHATTWALERRTGELNQSLGAATSAQDAAERVADVVARRHLSGLVRGTGFRQSAWPDEPHKSLLDRALPSCAVVLSSQDHHASWWSSTALRLLGMQHATGYLREHESWDAIAALPGPSAAEVDAEVAEAMQAAARRGVTEVVDYEFAGSLDDWVRRARAGPLPVIVTAGIVRHELDRAVDEGWRTGDVRTGIRVGALKLFADGALGSRTAWCDHAYVGEPGNAGMPLASREELAGLIGRAHGAGIATTIHAIGDAANRTALDAFEEAGVGGRVEHAQLLDPGDVRRFSALGVTASVQPGHAPDDRDLAARWWADRLDRAYPLRSLRDAGTSLVFGSDAPVAPLDPWRTIAAAVARTVDERPPWLPEQAIGLDEAIAASTNGPLHVGGPADLVIVEEDPWEMAVTDIPDVPVWATMAAGRWTHLAD